MLVPSLWQLFVVVVLFMPRREGETSETLLQINNVAKWVLQAVELILVVYEYEKEAL